MVSRKFAIQRIAYGDYLTDVAGVLGWTRDHTDETVVTFDSLAAARRRYYRLPPTNKMLGIVRLPAPNIGKRRRFERLRRWWQRVWCDHDMKRAGGADWCEESWYECSKCGFQCGEVDLPWL